MNTYGRGFTLIEMMVTVAIMVILVGLAIPSFQNLIETNRVATRASRLMSVLQLVRIEAIKRNATVRLCRSGDGSACDGESWQDDWLMWVDSESDGAHEADDPEEIVRVFESISGGVTVDNSRDLEWIGYRPDGVVIGSSGLANSTWTFCPQSNDDDLARKIVISRVGRPRLVKGADCSPD